MTFTAQHTETAEFANSFAELDIGASAGHVGRDRHRAFLARFGDDLRFACMVLRVEHFVPDLFLL